MVRLWRLPAAPRRCGRLPSVPRLRGLPRRGDLGMATAEYAIATLAACGFAGLLIVIMRSDEVRGLLTGIVQRALSTVG